MDLKEIKQVIDLMTRNQLSEFQLEKEGFRIHLKREGSGVHQMIAPVAAAPLPAPLAQPVLPAGMAPAAAVSSAPAASSEAGNFKEIVSPMVGTFYRSPSPESPAYVDVGTSVNPDTVVCIIEAMKVMNEIKAETKGVIVEVLVENGKSVEFGKPLFKIKPA